MSSNFVKRHNAIGWDWYLVTDEASSWVSHMVKEHIEQLEAENAKLRELLSDYSDCLDTALWLAADAGYPVMPAKDKFLSLEKRKRELGVEA